jgi:hypothetical protein
MGNQYIAASVVYLGIALILTCSTFLDSSEATASGESSCSYTVDIVQEDGSSVTVTYDGCPDGQQCCGGECISEDLLCCDDGTSGNESTCSCCDAEGGETSISCGE